MEMLFLIFGILVGLLVPGLFVFALLSGVRNIEERSQANRLRNWIWGIVIIWCTLIWITSVNTLWAWDQDALLPQFLLPLFLPIILGLLLLIFNKNFQKLVASIPLNILVGVQTFRLAGGMFLVTSAQNILPKWFDLGGYGDIVTGILAIIAAYAIANKSESQKTFFWLFSIAGILDLLNVATLLLWYYPSWYDGVPNSAPALEFSLVMIPVLAAPMAMLLHIFSIYSFVKK